MRQILVVDDEPIIRTFLAEGLTDAGYVVKTARNGAEALARASLFRSDAVLLDLLMPVMDGLTFLDERQAHPNLAGVPSQVLDDARRKQFQSRGSASTARAMPPSSGGA